MDRTPEFKAIVAQLRGGASAHDSGKHGQSGRVQIQLELNVLAKEISDAVATSSIRVSELRKLAKSTALFDDKTARIQALSFHVHEDINSLNVKIAKLEDQVKLSQTRYVNKTHSVNMVEILKMRLGEVAREAQMALEDRSNALQKQADRKYHMLSGRYVPRSAEARFSKQGQGEVAHDNDLEFGGQQFRRAPACRIEAVEKLQSAIAELATMFTQTASLVQEQQDKLGRIDTDLDVTQSSMDAAQTELLDYWHRLSSNRTLITKVFAILILFVFFFVVFLSD